MYVSLYPLGITCKICISPLFVSFYTTNICTSPSCYLAIILQSICTFVCQLWYAEFTYLAPLFVSYHTSVGCGRSDQGIGKCCSHKQRKDQSQHESKLPWYRYTHHDTADDRGKTKQDMTNIDPRGLETNNNYYHMCIKSLVSFNWWKSKSINVSFI